MNRTTNIAQNQRRNVTEVNRAFTGKILGSLAMLSDKILGRKSLSDNLKEDGTKISHTE
jgi:hypothetical protein